MQIGALLICMVKRTETHEPGRNHIFADEWKGKCWVSEPPMQAGAGVHEQSTDVRLARRFLMSQTDDAEAYVQSSLTEDERKKIRRQSEGEKTERESERRATANRSIVVGRGRSRYTSHWQLPLTEQRKQTVD